MSKKVYSLGGSTTLKKEEQEQLSKARKERQIEAQKNVEEKVKDLDVTAVKSYNETILVPAPELDNFELPAGKLLIRLFRAPRINESGIYIPATVTYVSENSGKLKTERTDDVSYVSRAVIVKVAPDLKEKYAPGTVVDLYMSSYKNITQFWSPLERETLSEGSTKPADNYFTVPESVINFIWTNYQMPGKTEKATKSIELG